MTVIHLLSGVLVAVTAMASTPLEIRTIAQGTLSGVERRREAVVRSAQEWEALWREHAPGRTAPAVSFETHTVLAVFLGTRPSAGFRVDIVEVTHDSGALVRYRETRPAPGEMTAQILTSPFHIVSVPRLEERVRFEPIDAAAR